MRVTNSLFYSSSSYDQQNSLKKLYDLNKQMDSQMKIQNSFEDSSIYVDTMRLNYEIATLDQVKATSSKAQTFAQNTDSTLNQFTEALTNFKTKLIQASSSTNSATSLTALANELTTIKEHMISLGNTSINGQFLFSGSSLLQKPLDSDGTYNGNNESLTALIGSGVELPYNIDGKSLFLGTDSDYNRTVSTNISMYNQSKLNPSVMVDANSNVASSKVYLSASDTIRDMVGDTNAIATDDPKSVFYLSGRKSNGETFATTIEINSSSKVSDLLESVGNAYGNTTTNSVVNVSMNERGQIEVKDLKSGNQLLEMNLFGAVDRDALAGTTGNAKQIMNVDNLSISPNVDIIAFNKSDFETTNSSPDLTMRSLPTSDAGKFSIDFPLTTEDTSTISPTTSLTSIFPSDVDHIMINNVTRFPLTGSLSGKTVQDLMTAIGGTTTLVNNQIITDTSVTLVPMNASNALAQGESLSDAMNYARRGFEKDGNELTSNISQVIKSSNQFATPSTKLVDVSGVSSLNGKQLVLNFTDINGKAQTGTLNLDIADTTFSIDLDGNGVTTDPNETFSIYNGKGDPLNPLTKADEMTYQQLSDVVSMAISGNLPKDGLPTDGLPYNPLGSKPKDAADYLLDADAFDAAALVAPDAVAKAKAIADATEARSNANILEYNYALNNSKNTVDVTLDYKGRLNIVDKSTSESKMKLNMYDKSATDFTGIGSVSLSFMANDSVAIENPTIDFFKDLDSMIEAVKTGNYRMDSASSDPRNIGIQNSLTKIDHILDHTTKEQTKIGAYSNALSSANDRAQYLSLNVKTVRSEIIDMDLAEVNLQFNQVSISYQAILSTISKINSMSLLKYM
ncbi:MAG: flagellin [Campylobacteraceae bacterium]|nr:flagellin [Campylobacteraceae bacterium]